MTVDPDCLADLESRFIAAVKKVWKNGDKVAQQLELTVEMEPDRKELGAIYRGRGKTVVIDDSLLMAPRNHRLVVSPRFCDEPRDVQDNVLMHEALHIGYPNHGKEFCRVAESKGIATSECGLRGAPPLSQRNLVGQVKVRGERLYRTVKVFPPGTPDDEMRSVMTAVAREQSSRYPTVPALGWRVIYEPDRSFVKQSHR